MIDSLNLSTGIGLLVLAAAAMNQSGRSTDEIVTYVNSLVLKVYTSFVIDTLDYLYLGGQCSSMELLMGNLLKIRPVIEVKYDGTFGVKDKIGSNRKKALNSMLQEFASHMPYIDTCRVFVTHTVCEEDAIYLKEELLKLATIEEICIPPQVQQSPAIVDQNALVFFT